MKIKSTGLDPKGLDLNKAENKGSKAGALDSRSNIGANPHDAAKINVSQRAQDINKIKQVATQAPDVDQAKVEKFRELINSGKYKIDAQAIADRMVDQELEIGKLEN
tara:strand:- start:5352 stop:5672 length:321 start_codon:yes stop_codon:yes gene_type:complete